MKRFIRYEYYGNKWEETYSMRFFCATEVTKANVTMELPPLTPIVQTTKAPPLQDKLPLDRKLSIQIGQG